MRHSTVGVVCVLLAVIASAGCQPQAERQGQGGPDGAPAPAGAASARFQATIYEVRVPAGRAGALAADALAAQAESPESLEKALSAVGKATVAYAVDQTVSLDEDRIHLGKREPFVTNSRATERGPRINTIQYEDVGVIFHIVGREADGGRDVKVEIEMSALTETGAEVAEGVPAVRIRTVVLGRSGPVRFGRPEALVAVDATTPDAQADAVAYVCRLVFTQPGP
jgi:hypothetical protein